MKGKYARMAMKTTEGGRKGVEPEDCEVCRKHVSCVTQMD